MVHGSMIPGSITGIHPDDGCGLGDFKIVPVTTDSSHKLENENLPNHWQLYLGFDSLAAIQVLT